MQTKGRVFSAVKEQSAGHFRPLELAARLHLKSRRFIMLAGCLMLLLTAVGQAQDFTYTNINGTVTITAYIGTNLTVSIPDAIAGLPVTTIGSFAFYNNGATNVTIPDSVTDIEHDAFDGLGDLKNITIPDSVTSIGSYAFYLSGLVTVTIGSGVTNIGGAAFGICPALTAIYCRGDAPNPNSSVFLDPHNNYTAIIYYLPGRTGWGTEFDLLAAKLWNPAAQTGDGSFGVRTNRFGFNVTGTSSDVVIIEACTDLANPVWLPMQTNTLGNTPFYFNDAQWSNHPGQFYRVRSP